MVIVNYAMLVGLSFQKEPKNMFKRAILLHISSLLIAGFLSLNAVAQEKHPIDKQRKTCLDKTSSTSGMMSCVDTSYKSWDAELNWQYKSLMKQLNKSGKKNLRKAQRDWIKYRDAEMKTIDAVYGLLEGTMWYPVALSDKMEITKQRALRLKGYLNVLTVGR